MAAPTTVLAGLDIIVAIGADVIAAGRGATLSMSSEGIDLTTRDASNWATSAAGTRSWTASYTGVLAKSAVLPGTGLIVSADADKVVGVKSVDIGFTSGTAETANEHEGYWTQHIGTRREMTLTIEADAYDNVANEGGGNLFTALTTSATTAIVVTIASGTTITVNCRVTSIEKGGEYEGIGTTTYSLVATAKPTFVTTGINATQLAVWTAFDTAARSVAQTVRFGPPNAPSAFYEGWTYYQGAAIPTAFNVTVNYTGEVTLAAEWQGSGSLAAVAVAAPL